MRPFIHFILSFGAPMAALVVAGNSIASLRDPSTGNSPRVRARDWNISPEDGIFPGPPPFTVSLVFPRNETSRPTQYFPIVFAVSNTDYVWPLGLGIYLTIQDTASEVPDLWDGYFYFPNRTRCDDSRGFCEGVTTGPPPMSPYFFWIDASSLTNKTESAQFVINWSLILKNVCTEKHGTGRPRTHLFSNDLQLRFSTAPHATQPDIEEAVNACPSTAFTIAPHASYYHCPPVFHDDGRSDVIWRDPKHNGTNSAPLCDDLKPYAKKISDVVSDAMLAKMGCKRGKWQDIKAPCLEEESKSRGHGGVQDMMDSALFGAAVGLTCIIAAVI